MDVKNGCTFIIEFHPLPHINLVGMNKSYLFDVPHNFGFQCAIIIYVHA